MKKLMALLLSVIMIVTFMPAMAFAETEPEEDASYTLEILNDGEVLPGEEFTLTAKVKKDGEEYILTGNEKFELYQNYNDVFDGNENDKIVDFGTEQGDPAYIPSNDGNWTCKVNFISGEDGKPHNGEASFYIKATIFEDFDIFAEGKINVDCHPSYKEDNVLDNGDKKLVELSPDSTGDFNLKITPFFGSDHNIQDLGFTYDAGYYEEDDQFNVKKTETAVGDDGIQLSRDDILDIISDHDPDFTLRVYTKGTIDSKPDTVIGCDEVVVLINIPNIFNECYMEFPSSIKYKPGQDIYDCLDEFVLKKKDGDAVVAENRQKLYEWRFVDKDPGVLSTKELGDPASILVDKTTGVRPDLYDEDSYYNNYTIPTSKDNFSLKFDHMGQYWVVAAGSFTYGFPGYTGYVIESFELTDADIYYEKRPKAVEEPRYNGNEPVELIAAGELNKGADATIQYRLDEGSWVTTIPATTELGSHTVSYRAVDSSNNVVIPAESVNVTLNKQLIRIKLKDVHKNYGTADPEFTLNELIDKGSDDVPNDLSISFTRERGEDVNEEGYAISPICDSEKYDVMVSSGRLFIDKADYNLSVMNKISFVAKGSYEIPYTTNADKVIVETEKESELSVNNADEFGNLVDGTLKLSAENPCREKIKLIVEEDDNHNGVKKEIEVVVTEKSLADGDAGMVYAITDVAKAFDGTYALSVEDPESTDIGDRATDTVSISLQNSTQENVTDFPNGIIVKVKLTDDFDNILGGTEPDIAWVEEPHNEPEVILEEVDEEEDDEDDEEGYPTWFEYIGDEAFFCFETNHLSTWTLSANPAMDISNIALKVNNFQIERTDEGYGEAVLPEDLVRFGDGDEDFVHPSCYKLSFTKSGFIFSTPVDSINGPGTYRVKAEAIDGSGFKGETKYSNKFRVTAHTHRFTRWNFNNETHWKECTGSGCEKIEGVGEHIYDRLVKSKKFLAKESTCTEYTKYYYSCECGAHSSETFSDETSKLKAHTVEFVKEAKIADSEYTCKKHYECTVCGKCFKDEAATTEYPIEEMIIKRGDDPTPPGPGPVPPTPTPGSDEEKFVEAKTSFIDECTALLVESEYPYIANLVEAAKTAINEAKYDSSLSLDENKAALTAIVDKLKTDIDAQIVLDEESTVMAALVKDVKVTQKALKTYKKGHKIKVTFKKAKVDGKAITSYQIYRKTGKSGTYKRVKTLTSKKSTITYTNKKLKKGKRYYYKVRGVVTLANGSKAYTKFSSTKSIKCK